MASVFRGSKGLREGLVDRMLFEGFDVVGC